MNLVGVGKSVERREKNKTKSGERKRDKTKSRQAESQRKRDEI